MLMKAQFNKLFTLLTILTLGIGQMWGELTAHTPGVYEKTVATGGYGCTLTTIASGENAGTFEVYYFSAQSKYGNTTDVYGGAGKQQYRLMCTDSDSEYQLINRNGTGTFTASCDWIEMAYGVTGFSKSDYTFGSDKFNEFFEITPNGGNTGITKTCYIKPKEGDVLTLKVSGYVEFAILGNDNGSSKYMTVAVDGGTPTSWKSNTLSRRSVTLTTGEHTIVVANVGTSANAFYGFSLKLPSCSTEITTQPSGATLAVGDANPTLSVVATNAASYAWKESSDGTSYDGGSTLASTASFTPEVNDAVQTKYYYCEVTSDCDGTTVVKSNIVTVNVVGAITYYTVTLNPAGGTIADATGWTLNAGNYEKEVAEGTVLTLPTFTKENRNFKTWRKAGPADVASPVTVNADLDLTAIWTATVENVIYSWEGAEGGATEVGGTAAGSNDGYINILSAGYYCFKIEGGTSYDKYVEITLAGEEKVKTGDKIVYWGFYNKSSSANARPKMRDGNTPNAQIFDDGTNLPNLYSGGDPAKREFTVPADINTNKVQITRSQTGSNTWIPKLQIIREVQVEEGNLLTVTFNSNGGSEVAAVQVASGQAVAKPADPTKAHNRFNEWQLSGSAYNFATPVTSNITLDADWTPLYTVTYAANGGSGTMTDANEYAAGDEVTLLANAFDAPDLSHVWDSWAVTDGSDNPVAVSEGKFNMPSSNATVTAQWTVISDFDVKFYQGYGEPDVQIGATQSISTGNYATAPAEDPERAGYRFLGWSYDATEAHIVDVASYAITAATNFTAMWIQQYAVTFDGAGEVLVDNGAPVASPNSPVTAGKVFQGWYNGESKYNFSAAVTENLALESKWADADANHFYYNYKDDFHYDGVVYKTPEGKVDEGAGASNVAITTPYTLFSGAEGITSIVATNAIYDSKSNWVNAYLKLNTNASSNLVFTIKSGYSAVLKMKMGGYSANPTVTLVDAGDNPVAASGTISGVASTENNYAEITYNLVAGTYTMTTTGKTLYISHIDLEATALPTFTVTYKAGDGTGDDVVDADATNVADVPGSFTAPEGKIFNGWKDGGDNDVAVGAIVTASMTLTAQWINHYAVTFNMNGHGDAIDPQDIKHGAKAAKPADPTATDYDFGGWYKEAGCTNAWDFANDVVTEATVLYAKWTVDPCLSSERKSLSKVVLTSTTEGTVTGYNSDEYAGTAVIESLKDDGTTADIIGDATQETGYKLNSSGKSIVFATLAKGDFQEGDRVIVGVIKKNDQRTVDESTDILTIYAGSDKDHILEVATVKNVSTPGFYTYRLTAANVTAINDAGYKSIGVFRASDNGENHYIYSVEIQGCRSWSIFHTLTFKNIDGTVDVATPALEEGAYASTVAPAAPKIAMKRFLGWSESVGGALVDLTSYTITADATLYAVYEDIVCPTTGTVYKFVVKDGLASENLLTSTDKDMSSYVDVIGDGYLTYTATADNKATVNSDGTIQLKDATAAYLKVELECTLTAGDQIRSNISNNPMRVQVATTFDADDDLILAKNVYNTVDITSAMVGKNVLYIARSTNGNANIADFEIYRPAKYDVSFNMMGHGSAIADLTDVPEGSKIVAPDPAPTDVDYSFAGWYKENTLENEWDFDNDVVNAATTLYAKWLDKSDATLKSLKYGDEDITLVDGIDTYNISLPAFTSAVPALTAVPNNPNATAVPTNAAAFDGEGNATSTVLVTPESGTPQTYTVNFSKGVEVTLQDVTGSITWDFANAVSANVSITNTPQVLANYGGVTNDATFESDKLEASGEKFTAGSKANLRAKTIHFRTTVPGMLSISYSNTGGSNPARYIYVNGVKYDNDGSANTTPKGIDNKVFVPAGDVYLEMKDGEDAPQNIQVYKIIFNDQADYTRNVTEGRYGTICLPNGGVMVGAELYEVAYYGATSQKIFLDQIPSGEMVAGRPYIFLPREGASQLGVFYTDAADADAGSHNGLIGSYTKEPIAANAGNYILLNNQYCPVESTVDPVYVGANKAYIKLGDITPTEPALKPGAKRVGLGVAAPQTPTGVDNLNATDAPVKVMINGQMYILRGEKMYNANGQLVK